MQREVIAKGLAELFMLLARANEVQNPPRPTEAPSSQGQDQTPDPPPAPASEGLTEGEGAFEQAVGECPCCAAFVGPDEVVENPLGVTIYFGDCPQCGVPVMWMPEVLVSMARTPQGELVLMDGEDEDAP